MEISKQPYQIKVFNFRALLPQTCCDSNCLVAYNEKSMRSFAFERERVQALFGFESQALNQQMDMLLFKN